MKKFAKTTDINKRIKKVRERSGLTQKEFSDRIGISRSYLSEIEANKVKPSIEALTGILLRFEIDGRWLLMGADAEGAAGGYGGAVAAESPAPYRVPSKTASFPVIPLLNEKVVAGPPRSISSKEIAGYLPVWDGPPPKLGFCFYAQDGGMAPFLRRGALVEVTPFSGSLKKLEGKIVAAWLPKEGLVVRRLRSDRKYLILEPENKSYPTRYVERPDRAPFFIVTGWRQRQDASRNTSQNAARNAADEK